jgi:uncharacterized membrane protein
MTFCAISCSKHAGYYMYHLLQISENPTFWPHIVWVCILWLSQRKLTTSINIINGLVFVMDIDCVLCEVGLTVCVVKSSTNFKVQNVKKIDFLWKIFFDILRKTRRFISLDDRFKTDLWTGTSRIRS